ncbi:MAG: hypothetical protein ACK5YG_14665 [Alphaproteobacteria bacterium]
MKKIMIASAVLLSFAGATSTAQAENFLVSLLQSVTWQPPKCTAPEVLTQVKDRAGNIHFRCMKPPVKK